MLPQPLRFSFSRSALTNSGGVSHHHLKTEEEFSPKFCSFSRRFAVLASCYQSRIIPFVRYSFSYPSRVCQKLFSRFFSPEAIILEEFFVLTFQLPLSIYPGASFKCSLISSLSLCSFASKSPSSILVLLILLGDSFSFISHFQILTMDHSRFFVLIIILIHSFFSIPMVDH